MVEPSWSICVIAWDETAQQATLSEYSKKNASIQLMCIKIWLSWGRGANAHSMELLIPAIPLANTASDSMWHALQHHPLLNDYRWFINNLCANATLNFKVHLTDNASGNTRLNAWHFAVCPLTEMFFPALCYNHQIQLVSVDLQALFGVKMFTLLYSGANFIRMGLSLRCRDNGGPEKP